MRPFDTSEFPFFFGGANRLRSHHHGLNNRIFGGGQKKPMIYMVPTEPTKPAFLMKPNTNIGGFSPIGGGGGGGVGRPVNYGVTAGLDCATKTPPSVLNNQCGNLLASPYQNNKFERFPNLANYSTRLGNSPVRVI